MAKSLMVANGKSATGCTSVQVSDSVSVLEKHGNVIGCERVTANIEQVPNIEVGCGGHSDTLFSISLTFEDAEYKLDSRYANVMVDVSHLGISMYDIENFVLDVQNRVRNPEAYCEMEDSGVSKYDNGYIVDLSLVAKNAIEVVDRGTHNEVHIGLYQ